MRGWRFANLGSRESGLDRSEQSIYFSEFSRKIEFFPQ